MPLFKDTNQIIKLFSLLIISGILIFCAINANILYQTKTQIHEQIEDVPPTQAALVLGARVYRNGQPSHTFLDRLTSAANLYKAAKVSKIIVSGDHGQADYDEVNAGKDYLLELQIPAADIFLDHAGFDTYDSLYRANAIFQADSITVVTQNFHLPRAVYIGQKLDLTTYGYTADLRIYQQATRNQIRESLARIKAFLDVTFKAKPQFLGDPIPITTSNGQASWD